MPLLERVSTLLRANLNDLLDKAEDPEKLAKEIILDLENQLLQVKTQVAFAISDQHRLLQQQREHEVAEAKWRQNAELALGKGDEELARSALEQSLSHSRSAAAFAEQHAEQTADTDTLRTAYSRLQAKLTETRARVEVLVAQHRRHRIVAGKHADEPIAAAAATSARLARLRSAVARRTELAETHHAAHAVANDPSLEERFQSIKDADQIDALLEELKAKKPRLES